jgi:dephospho-CoA kinase
VITVGLTGGIGSGKSEVSARLAARGAVVVDADLLAREVVEPGTAGLAAVLAEFSAEVGPGLVGAHGRLDRAALARLVFADAGARHRLESIVHPLVGARAAELIKAAADDAIVVYDVPLLVENHLGPGYDCVVVVDAADQTRLARLAARGVERADALARMAAQASRADRLAAADHVVPNDGTLADLDIAVEALWGELGALARSR